LCNDAQADCWVTSASLSPDNNHLALLNHNKIWWFSCFNGSSFFKGSKATINLNSNTQKEGIAFKNSHEVYITDELSVVDNSGGNLYEADLNAYLQMPQAIIIPDSIICDNCTLTIDSFIGALSWDNGLFGPSITPTYTGWYKANAKSLNNCIASDSVYISYLQGISQQALSSTNLIIQNTSKNNISGVINTKNIAPIQLQVTDITGKIILNKTINSNSKSSVFSLDVELNIGIYLINLINQSENKTYKFVITH
jgi:hypothetical protein